MIACALQQVAFEVFCVLMEKVGFSFYYELKNINKMLDLTVHSELEVELQVIGEPVTGEFAAAKKGSARLFLSLSLLPAVWYEPKRMLALIFVQSQGNILLLASSAERLFWCLEC